LAQELTASTMTTDSVLADYQKKLLQLRPRMDHARAAQKLSVRLLVATVAVIALLFLGAPQWHIPAWSIALPLPAVVGAGWSFATARGRWLRLHRLHTFYERGRARIEDRWHGNGFAGEEFRIANHVYDLDLQVLGAGSLFEFLCTARTGIGRRRLAEYLLRPCDISEAIERQEAVRELKPFAEIRERIALLGKYDFQDSTWEIFSEWISNPAATAPAWVRWAAFASSTALGALLLAGFITNIHEGTLFPWMPPLLAINMAIAWYFRKRTASLNDAARRVGVEIGVAREGIDFLSTLTFRSARLQAVQKRLENGNAASALRQLERLTNAISECDKPYFDLPSQALIIRTQLCFAIEEWKLRYASHLEQWLDAWAEFEVLTALSGYAWEHPDDQFPQFYEGHSTFTARDLGHPLIPARSCVRNNVALDAGNRFYVVSGSNMSGKSTLLRSIGLNAILAKAGAPVRAASLSLTILEVFASLSIVDSLLEGKSKFLAEVERVRQTLECSRNSQVLFLIDEILSGTNSRDRRIASESIIGTLLKHGAIGALSTHDLALTEIAEIEGFSGSNVHMGSRSGEDAMDFDYLLKPGVTTETNALAIVAMMGVPLV
jgi:hypothetical protein